MFPLWQHHRPPKAENPDLVEGLSSGADSTLCLSRPLFLDLPSCHSHPLFSLSPVHLPQPYSATTGYSHCVLTSPGSPATGGTFSGHCTPHCSVRCSFSWAGSSLSRLPCCTWGLTSYPLTPLPRVGAAGGCRRLEGRNSSSLPFRLVLLPFPPFSSPFLFPFLQLRPSHPPKKRSFLGTAQDKARTSPFWTQLTDIPGRLQGACSLIPPVLRPPLSLSSLSP